MRLQVLGIQRMDYTFQDGNEIHGIKLHGIDLDKQSDDLYGQAVDTITIMDDSALALSGNLPNFEIGNEYYIGFAKGSKKVDIIIPVT